MTVALNVIGFIVVESEGIAESTLINNPGWLAWLGLVLFFVAVAICVISQLVLWSGMLLWSALWPGEWWVIRVLLVAAQLLTLNIGSALVYLLIYRRQHDQAQRFLTRQAGVSG